MLRRRANKQGAITSFCVGVIAYAAIYQGWIPGIEAITNPFAASGYSILLASVVMVVTGLLTKPMTEEFVEELFDIEVVDDADSLTISQ